MLKTRKGALIGDTPARLTAVAPHLTDADVLLTRREAAAYLRKSVPTLERWSKLGIGPKPRMVGRAALYPLGELRAYAGGEAA